MIIDLKKVKLGDQLANGTLWIIEQIPGLVVGTDQTAILRNGWFFCTCTLWSGYVTSMYAFINRATVSDMCHCALFSCSSYL